MHPLAKKAGLLALWVVSGIACTGSGGGTADTAAPGATEVSSMSYPIMCTLVACESGATLKKPVDASVKELKSSTLTFCRNDVCQSVPLKLLAEANTGNGRPASQLLYFPTHEERVQGQPQLLVFYDTLADGSLELTATHSPYRNEDLTEHDTYSVTVTTPQGRKLVDVRKTVTYTISKPNGPRCRPTCFNAMLN